MELCGVWGHFKPLVVWSNGYKKVLVWTGLGSREGSIKSYKTSHDLEQEYSSYKFASSL